MGDEGSENSFFSLSFFHHFGIKNISAFLSYFIFFLSISSPVLRLLWLIFLIIYHLNTTLGGGPYFSSNVNGISDKRVRLLPIDFYCFSQMKNKLFLWFILEEGERRKKQKYTHMYSESRKRNKTKTKREKKKKRIPHS